MNIDTLATTLASLATIGGAFAAIAAIIVRRLGGLRRVWRALRSAIDLHSGHTRGVVLALSAPGMDKERCAIPLLRERGYIVCPYTMGDGDTFVIPDGDAFLADVAAADVVIVQGYPEREVAALAAHRPFRDRLRSGAIVILYTTDFRVRYDFAPWGAYVQGVTTALTADMWTSQGIHRRREIASLQGIRPGKLAAAREELLAR